MSRENRNVNEANEAKNLFTITRINKRERIMIIERGRERGRETERQREGQRQRQRQRERETKKLQEALC